MVKNREINRKEQIGLVTPPLAAITWTIKLVPYHSLESMQPIWRLGIIRFQLMAAA